MTNERQLSVVLTEFARTMVTDFPIQAILDHLIQRIVEVLPITAAGVTLISPGSNPRYLAASNDAALQFEELQSELGEGPCVMAFQTRRPVAVPDLRLESRFPAFSKRALALGLHAVFTFPLCHEGEPLGALDLYRDQTGPLDVTTQSAAQTLADVAAAYLLNAQARKDLQDASKRSLATALHDPLTGLPNRVLLLEHLDRAVQRARRSRKMTAVLFLDLDRFKLVNDLYGHSVGDELLVEVAKRLNEALRASDTLARLSGDEFVILCEDLNEPAEAHVIAARVGEAVAAAPFVLSENAVEITASVGIAYSGRGDQLSGQLLEDADIAMYQAKRKGGARHQIVDLREQQLAEQRVSLERDLQGALARGELRNEYQPIVTTSDGRVVGVEALVRWDNPSRGLVMPTLMIPIAEQSDLIVDIGRWVLERSCHDRTRWQRDHGIENLTISVNVSPKQLMSPNYVATMVEVLSDTRTDPTDVTLEVTEGVFVQDSQRALVVLDELKRVGVALALDDFGTGYSSLTYLKGFPIDVVKIDRGFVADLERDPANHAIVESVIELAHRLAMTVVAEGVETTAQHEQLVALGCDYCQGYYFARPMSGRGIDTLFDQSPIRSVAHLPAAATR